MDTSTIVWIIVIIVVVAVIAGVVVAMQRKRKAEQHREQAASLRQEAVQQRPEVDRAREEAEEAERRAEEARRAHAQAAAQHEDQLRTADRVDPDVDHESTDYEPSAPEGPAAPETTGGQHSATLPDQESRQTGDAGWTGSTGNQPAATHRADEGGTYGESPRRT